MVDQRALALIAILSFPPAAARAHAMLDHAEPPVGGSVAQPPPLVRLYFSQAVEPAFSTVTVETAAGASVPTAKPSVVGDGTEVDLAVPPLAPAAYRVRWRVVSVDTHVTEGDFTFQVQP